MLTSWELHATMLFLLTELQTGFRFRQFFYYSLFCSRVSSRYHSAFSCHVSPVFSVLWQFLCFLVFYDLESLEESWPRVYLLFKSLKLTLMGTAVRNSFLYRCLSLHFVLHIFFPRVLKGFIKILYCLSRIYDILVTDNLFLVRDENMF